MLERWLHRGSVDRERLEQSDANEQRKPHCHENRDDVGLHPPTADGFVRFGQSWRGR